jgi:hypothetical protein
MRNTILLLALVLFGCDNSNGQATTQPQAEVTSIPADPPPPPRTVKNASASHAEPNCVSKDVHDFRFADFTCSTTNYYKDNAKTNFDTWVRFTPTRQGAYLIEGADHAEKLVSGNESGEATLLQFAGTGCVVVTFSDGKSIERTYVTTK